MIGEEIEIRPSNAFASLLTKNEPKAIAATSSYRNSTNATSSGGNVHTGSNNAMYSDLNRSEEVAQNRESVSSYHVHVYVRGIVLFCKHYHGVLYACAFTSSCQTT
jgi:hypothetical protein